MSLFAFNTTPLAMALLTGGTAAFAMGLFANLYRFYNEKKERVVEVEDYLLWTGVLMIIVSLSMTFF